MRALTAALFQGFTVPHASPHPRLSNSVCYPRSASGGLATAGELEGQEEASTESRGDWCEIWDGHEWASKSDPESHAVHYLLKLASASA